MAQSSIFCGLFKRDTILGDHSNTQDQMQILEEKEEYAITKEPEVVYKSNKMVKKLDSDVTIDDITMIDPDDIRQQFLNYFENAEIELPKKLQMNKVKTLIVVKELFQESFRCCRSTLNATLKESFYELTQLPLQKESLDGQCKDLSDVFKAYHFLLKHSQDKLRSIDQYAIDQVIRSIPGGILLPHDEAMEAIKICWKMQLLDEPFFICQPEVFNENWHEIYYDNSDGEPNYELVYYRPVLINSAGGQVACKGLVGKRRGIKAVSSSKQLLKEENPIVEKYNKGGDDQQKSHQSITKKQKRSKKRRGTKQNFKEKKIRTMLIDVATAITNLCTSSADHDRIEAMSAMKMIILKEPKPKVLATLKNLPYLFDGDVKIIQTNACKDEDYDFKYYSVVFLMVQILTYLGRKANLYGKTEADMATVDMLLNVAMDFRNGFVRLCYSSQMESMKEEYLKTVRAKLEEMSKYLGDKPWFAGNEITFPDFHFYEMFDQHREFHPQLFDGLDNLKAYMDRFEVLPAIKSYMDSPEFIRWPINNPIAQWRGNKKL
uniref:glutathione transferase n=1 Tax=Amphimedon queenslandica TaxID=400682 RepID=A0A1X7UU52_AMPQE